MTHSLQNEGTDPSSRWTQASGAQMLCRAAAYQSVSSVPPAAAARRRRRKNKTDRTAERRQIPLRALVAVSLSRVLVAKQVAVGMAQQVGFTRSKTKPLSPGFFPAEKERQFAESQQSDPQQRAEEQDEMPPPPARPNEPAAQSQERAAGQTLRAYSLDGPVEAVGLQADSEFWQVFEDIETLGRGHFAKVKLVSHLHTREEFAAKILDKTTADNDIEDLVREFQMLRSLRHPNIIRLFAAYETPRKLYLVTEVADPSTT